MLDELGFFLKVQWGEAAVPGGHVELREAGPADNSQPRVRLFGSSFRRQQNGRRGGWLRRVPWRPGQALE